MANVVNITQEQWDKLTSTLQLAAQRAEQWTKEREGLAAMLTQAREALMLRLARVGTNVDSRG